MDCGADPRDAWDYTPGELRELIRGWQVRQKEKGYFGFNLAQCIASMILSRRRPEPWEAFPGMIEYESMTDEQIWAALAGWAEREDQCEQET